MPRKIHILAIFCMLLPASTVFPQDIYTRARNFLNTKTSRPEFSSEFSFTKESRDGNQVILESNDPPCFVIFQKSDQDHKVIGYSTSNSFSRNDSVQAVAKDFLNTIKEIPTRMLLKTS